MPTKKKPSALRAIVGESIQVRGDGENSLIVPLTADGNKMANMVMAAKMRLIMDGSLKKYTEQDALLTPKEIKDLADAAKSIASFSAEVYQGGDTNSGRKAPKDDGRTVIDVPQWNIQPAEKTEEPKKE